MTLSPKNKQKLLERFDNRPENLEVYLIREAAIVHALNGKWTRKFDHCVICHSREYRNASKGVCWKCYKHIRKPAKPKQEKHSKSDE